MTADFYIAAISPNGSTGKVAAALADQLTRSGASVTLADLSQAGEARTLLERMKGAEQACLLMGSPVYRDMAVPPVMAWIDALPRLENAWAVPFVTYGRASSGVALWQMATALAARGFAIAGAAKVVAVHSLMWQSGRPEGSGHPDAGDLALVRQLADGLVSRFAAGSPVPLSPKDLDYQPDALAVEFKAKLEKPWMIVPKRVDENLCTGCGVCMDQCPAGAIALTPLPEFSPACFDCFNCIRLCPESAIAPVVPLSDIAENIRQRVKTIDEQPLTRIFPPGPEV